jgi:hypothetical protein
VLGRRRKQPNEKVLPYTFSIAGAQKSGTSSLSALLDAHPQIKPAPRKEMNIFNDESRDWTTVDTSDLAVAARPRHRHLGDATPLYLWWPQAMERMHAYNPDMKIVGIFRDPIERLFSNWMMVVTRWQKTGLDWPGFLTKYAPDDLEDQIPEGVNVHGYRMHSGVVRGYYGAQLERANALFGSDNVHTLEFRAFLRDHAAALDSLTDFLDLPRFKEYPPLPHAMRGRETVVGTPPTGQDIADLVDRYANDFEVFKKLSGLDCSEWPLQRLINGDLAVDELAAQYAKKVVPGERPRKA